MEMALVAIVAFCAGVWLTSKTIKEPTEEDMIARLTLIRLQRRDERAARAEIEAETAV